MASSSSVVPLFPAFLLDFALGALVLLTDAFELFVGAFVLASALLLFVGAFVLFSDFGAFVLFTLVAGIFVLFVNAVTLAAEDVMVLFSDMDKLDEGDEVLSESSKFSGTRNLLSKSVSASAFRARGCGGSFLFSLDKG